MLETLISSLRNNPDVFDSLLNSCPTSFDINQIIDKQGNTLLHLATLKTYPKIIRILLQNKATLSHNSYGLTPLHIAAASKSNLLAIFLEFEQCDLEALSNPSKATPLHTATSKRLLSNMMLLLKKGANVNALNKDKLSPLDITIQNKDSKGLSLLLFWGADIPNSVSDKTMKEVIDNYSILRGKKSIANSLFFLNKKLYKTIQLPTLKQLSGLVIAQSDLRNVISTTNQIPKELKEFICNFPKKLESKITSDPVQTEINQDVHQEDTPRIKQ